MPKIHNLAMKIILIVASLVLWAVANIQAQDLSKKTQFSSSIYERSFERYVGTINNDIAISVFWEQRDSVVRGTYFYDKIGEPISIWGVVNYTGELELVEEWDEQTYQKKKFFSCRFSENKDTVAGTWHDLEKGRNYPVKIIKSPVSGISVNKIIMAKSICNDGSDTNTTYAVGGCNEVSIGYDEIELLNKAIQDNLANEIFAQIGDAVSRYPQVFTDDSIPRKINVNSIIRQQSDLLPIIDSLLKGGDISFDIELRVISIQESILSLGLDTYIGGGAHGVNASYISNFDLKTGKKIDLDRFVEPYNIEAFFQTTDSIHKAKKNSNEFDDIASILIRKYRNRDNNFLLTPGGFLFVFNLNEIGSYVEGSVEIFVPFKLVKGLIKNID